MWWYDFDNEKEFGMALVPQLLEINLNEKPWIWTQLGPHHKGIERTTTFLKWTKINENKSLQIGY